MHNIQLYQIQHQNQPIWIKVVLFELGFPRQQAPILQCDNFGVIYPRSNIVFCNYLVGDPVIIA